MTDVLCYVNAEIGSVRPLRDYRGFHVIRDPRDVGVSGYFSHLHSHPIGDWYELAEHRRELQSLPRHEGWWRRSSPRVPASADTAAGALPFAPGVRG